MGFESGDSFIATEAALGIDMYLRGEENKYENSLKDIANKLEEISVKDIFPRDLTMLAGMYWPDKKDWKGKTTKTLQEKIAYFSTRLKNYKDISKDDQKELKQDLIKLSDSIAINMDGSYRRGLAA